MITERAPNLASRILENLKQLGGTIGVDIDGVTQATYAWALKKASHDLKTYIPKEQLTSYWELAEIARQRGIEKAESLEYARQVWNDNEVFRNSPPLPGARSLTRLLHELSIPYVFISSRPPDFWDTTRE